MENVGGMVLVERFGRKFRWNFLEEMLYMISLLFQNIRYIGCLNHLVFVFVIFEPPYFRKHNILREGFRKEKNGKSLVFCQTGEGGRGGLGG